MVPIDRRLRSIRKNLMYMATETRQLIVGQNILPILQPARRDDKPHQSISRNAIRILFLIAIPALYLLSTYRNTPTTKSALIQRWIPTFPTRHYIPLQHANPTEISGVSIVTACKNHHQYLKSALSNWELAKGIDEILIIDWDSSPPLQPHTVDKVRVIRVENEQSWVLTRAYNLGVSLARHEWILRLDCDFTLSPSFMQSHPATPRAFWSGHWRGARSDEELHLNGALLIRRRDFLQINGYDERIQTYGWEDEDLFARLVSNGLKRNSIDYDLLQHIPHEDTNMSRVNIDYNSLLLQHVPPWNGTATLASPNGTQLLHASIYKSSGGLSATSRPTELAHLVSTSARERDWRLALGRRLHDDHGVCWDLMSQMKTRMRERLLGRLEGQGKGRGGVVVTHVMHGLGNRLRALASGMAFAHATNRVLIVVWEVDRHCGARFEDLFETELVVTEGIGLAWPFEHAVDYDGAWSEWDLYNYMEREGGSAHKGGVVKDGEKNVYFKGAYVMESHHVGWKDANEQMRGLVAVREIREAVRALEGRLKESVGMHVRHVEIGKDIADVSAEKEYGEFEARVLAFWRSEMSTERFVKAAGIVREEIGMREVFLCADSRKWRAEIKERIGNVWWINDESCEDRSKECIKGALVELLALAKTRVVIGSVWSSFSEAAARLGARDVRLVGIDFGEAGGTDGFGDDVAELVEGVRRKRRLRKKH